MYFRCGYESVVIMFSLNRKFCLLAVFRHRLRLRYRSLFRSNQVCYALPEGVCPVGDVQAEGFLYLGLVQNGVGGSGERVIHPPPSLCSSSLRAPTLNWGV